MSRRILVSVLVGIFSLLSMILAVTRDFSPDFTFQGSSLTGWRPIGQVDWTAANGEIVGIPKSPEGGWLLLDKGYQDVEVYTEFRCSGPCTAGLLLRAEKAPDGGLKGIYVQAGEGNVFEVTLNAQGEGSKTRDFAKSNCPVHPHCRGTVGEWRGPGARLCTSRSYRC